MRPVIRALSALALVTSLLFAPGQAQAQVRPEIGKPLQEASSLLKANRAKDALAKLRDADAVPNKTPAEQLTIERMRAAVASRAGETATAVKANEAVFAGAKAGSPEQTQAAEQLAYLYSQTKDWNKTRDWATKAKQLGGNAAELDKLLAFVNAQSGDYAQVAKDAQAAIEAAEKAGKRPEEGDLLRLADALRRGGNNAGQAAVLEKLITHYPKKDYWAIVLGRLQSKQGFSPRLTLDVMRLRRETKTLESAEDYVEMTQLALQDGQAVEARSIIEEGFARGLLGKGPEAERQKRLQALANQRATSAAADLEAAAVSTADDKSGDALVRIGLAYSALGQHDKAAALIQQGIKKGGLRNANIAQLHLGIAFARAGQKERAVQAWRQVGGNDGAADLARLWTRAI
jgi:lipopolysaccharide biosynthesis regulator YciM